MKQNASPQETYGASLSHPLINGLYEPGYGTDNHYPPVSSYGDRIAKAESTPPQTLKRLSDILDSTFAAFGQGDSAYRLMAELSENLGSFYRENKHDVNLLNAAKHMVTSHELGPLINECPFSHHAHVKPRGYAGDAELMDYIYRHDSIAPKLAATTARGRYLALQNHDCPAAAAVRNRRNIVASRISEIAGRRTNARIMSVACGHARELELLSDETLRSIKEFVAVDQDPRSLEVTGRYKDELPSLVTHQASIVELMKDRDLVGFDFIYASGLYDYLSDRLASKLTERLFAGLKPGGHLLLANFLPGIRDIGYMEFLLDWQLIYRDEEQIRAFTSRLDKSDIARQTYFAEPNHNIGFLEIVRR